MIQRSRLLSVGTTFAASGWLVISEVGLPGTNSCASEILASAKRMALLRWRRSKVILDEVILTQRQSGCQPGNSATDVRAFRIPSVPVMLSVPGGWQNLGTVWRSWLDSRIAASH